MKYFGLFSFNWKIRFIEIVLSILVAQKIIKFGVKIDFEG